MKALSHVQAFFRISALLRNKNVPLWIRALPLLAAIYLISPLDFIPDLLPVIGWIDDIGMVLTVVSKLISEVHKTQSARQMITVNEPVR